MKGREVGSESRPALWRERIMTDLLINKGLQMWSMKTCFGLIQKHTQTDRHTHTAIPASRRETDLKEGKQATKSNAADLRAGAQPSHRDGCEVFWSTCQLHKLV